MRGGGGAWDCAKRGCGNLPCVATLLLIQFGSTKIVCGE